MDCGALSYILGERALQGVIWLGCCVYLLNALAELSTGTAACVLAHRLTEDPKTSVLMIEAGKRYVGNSLAMVNFDTVVRK